MANYNWKTFGRGRACQVCLTCGDDIAHLAELDKKRWMAISMPIEGVRFDTRMLQLMDADGDGRIRTPEVLAAIEFLKARNVDLNDLFKPDKENDARLHDVLARQADLANRTPSEEDKAALAAWEEKGKSPEIDILPGKTAAAEAALTAVEKTIDDFFTPPEDMPLVTEEADKELPLRDHLNPKYLEAILDFAAKCVTPLFGEKQVLTRLGWKEVKAAFAPYRAWVAAKPVVSADAKAALDDEEREVRYRIGLKEFLENYVNMSRLYNVKELAIFQTGTLRIDAKELKLCFHVSGEAAHAALAEKSRCCVLYVKLTRPSEKLERTICAVVTAGAVAGLYVGRNGVFYDRDGKDWEAVVTRMVESQVSLVEAFWAPWRKLGEGIAKTVKKFIGDKQDASMKAMQPVTQNPQAGGAAMASSVAAIGIGVGMMGAACASLMAVIGNMVWWQILVSILAVIAVVSIPSVILTWFKLRKRDLGAILNACGWAINRPMRFSMRLARTFTKCA